MDIFKNTQFLKLWGNQILLQIAFNMSNLTALLLIDQLTSSRFALSQFYAAMTIPAFVVGIFAGTIVDISNRKKLMLITDAALAILFASYAFFTDSYWMIVLIAFVSSSVSQFFTPAEAATIPLIVKGKQLNNANALFLFTGLGSVITGYALAGPLIDVFGGINQRGDEVIFIFSGILTLIGFFLRLSLKTIDTPFRKVPKGEIIEKTREMTKEVLATAKQDIRIYLPILLLTLVQFYIGILSILFIDFVKTYLNLPATATSFVLVLPLMVGLTIGTWFLKFTHKKYRRGKVIYYGTFIFGLSILGLGLASNTLIGDDLNSYLLRSVTVLVSTGVGIAAVLISVHARTILQEHTPEYMLGRVFALVTIASSAITPLPILLLGLITEKVETSIIFTFFGITSVMLALLLRRPLVRRLY